MADVSALWADIMATVEAGAEQGLCTCKALHHVADNPNFVETVNDMMEIAAGILNFSSPEAIEANVGHFLTAVIALGYALGSQDAYDVVLMSDLSVPDNLADFDFIEEFGERPDSE